MENKNGCSKNWIVITFILTAIIIPLIAVVYGGLVEGKNTTAQELKNHQEKQIETDKQTALILQSVDNRLSNIEKALKISNVINKK